MSQNVGTVCILCSGQWSLELMTWVSVCWQVHAMSQVHSTECY